MNANIIVIPIEAINVTLIIIIIIILTIDNAVVLDDDSVIILDIFKLISAIGGIQHAVVLFINNNSSSWQHISFNAHSINSILDPLLNFWIFKYYLTFPF